MTLIGGRAKTLEFLAVEELFLKILPGLAAPRAHEGLCTPPVPPAVAPESVSAVWMATLVTFMDGFTLDGFTRDLSLSRAHERLCTPPVPPAVAPVGVMASVSEREKVSQ